MRKNLLRILSAILAVAMLLSLVSCKPKKKKKPTKKPSSSSQQEDISSTSSDFDFDYSDDLPDDLGGDDDWWDDDEISDDWDTSDDWDSEISDDWGDDWGDDEWEEEPEYISPFQKFGTESEDGERTIEVDLSKVEYEDFLGIGGNIFPSLDSLARNGLQYNEALHELTVERFTSYDVKTVRIMTPPHWFITNEEEDPYREDFQNNKDYINYMKGVYDLESDKMKSLYKYLDTFQEIGTEVAINFGWGCDQRLQSWWPVPVNEELLSVGAPDDLKQWAHAVSTVVKYMREVKGYTCVKAVTFYNEPGTSGDFQTLGDNATYWAMMAKEIDAAFKEQDIREDVQICAAELVLWANGRNWNYLDKVLSLAGDVIDNISVHQYYNGSVDEDDYYNFDYGILFDNNCFMKARIGDRNIHVGEFYAGIYTQNATWVSWQNWDDSTASYFIACSHTGVSSMNKWEITGGWIDNLMTYLSSPRDNDTFALPKNSAEYGTGMLEWVHLSWYEESLLNTYVPLHSKVLYNSWIGEDIKSAAYKTPSGDYTVIVEAQNIDDNLEGEREFTINFSESLGGKTVYKFYYDPDQIITDESYPISLTEIGQTHKFEGEGSHSKLINPNANIIPCSGVIKNVKTSISDKTDGHYGFYVYTTMKPVKQVELVDSESNARIQVELKAGESVDLYANLIDCSNETLDWEVTKVANAKQNTVNDESRKGTITSTGATTATYTAPANAKAGDDIAIRTYIKSDRTRFAVTIVHIVE